MVEPATYRIRCPLSGIPLDQKVAERVLIYILYHQPTCY